MPDPNPAKNSSRPAPQLAEVRRILDRYRRATETARPRRARRRREAPPTLPDPR